MKPDGPPEALDRVWDVFGADRVVYGSNWPVSDRAAPYGEILRTVREYFAARGQRVLDAFFWKNSVAAYRYF